MAPPRKVANEVILSAAFQAFCAHGLRKASMDDIAHQVGISRQKLYVRFPTKEALFRATLESIFEKKIVLFRRELEMANEPLENRLINAFDVLMSLPSGFQHLEEICASASALIPTSEKMYLTTVDCLVKTLDNTYVARRWAALGLTPRMLGEHLMMMSKGVETRAKTSEDYRSHMKTAIALLCLGNPLF